MSEFDQKLPSTKLTSTDYRRVVSNQGGSQSKSRSAHDGPGVSQRNGRNNHGILGTVQMTISVGVRIPEWQLVEDATEDDLRRKELVRSLFNILVAKAATPW